MTGRETRGFTSPTFRRHVAGCLAWMFVVAPAYAATEEIPAPSAYRAGSGGAVDDVPWWQEIGGPELRAWVEEAIRANADLTVARDRIASADAAQFQALTALLPSFSLDTNLNATPASLRFASFTGGTADEIKGLYYLASSTFNASIELDITGRNALGVAAAGHDEEAVAADADQVAQALASRVAGAWLDATLAGERLALLDRLVQHNRDLLAVVELRFGRAEATGLDVLQQRQQILALEAQRPLVQAQRAVALQSLGLLLGRPADQAPAESAAALPDLGASPAMPSPSDIDRSRADLRAASLRLTSAHQRRVAAERSFLPTLRLTANAGWSFTNNKGAEAFSGGASLSEQLAPLVDVIQQFDPTFTGFEDTGTTRPTGFQSWFTWGFGGQLSIPIFNGGRSVAQLRQARAAESTAAHTLTGARLAAWAAVETASANDQQQQLRQAAIADQVAAAQQTWELARQRYGEGIGDYLSVLTSLSTWQNAEITALQAHRDALAARIQLHDALGGTWNQDLHRGQP